jgi:hypothetical protein
MNFCCGMRAFQVRESLKFRVGGHVAGALPCCNSCLEFSCRGGYLENIRGLSVVSGASVVLALLQSVCTAVLTINSIRLGIGLTALFAGGIAAPLISFHHSSIRIPMLVLAVIGAVLDLAVLAWIRHLRARPEAQWRQREITKKQRRSERLQFALSILTLVLVSVEVWAHPIVHRNPFAPGAAQTSRQ